MELSSEDSSVRLSSSTDAGISAPGAFTGLLFGVRKIGIRVAGIARSVTQMSTALMTFVGDYSGRSRVRRRNEGHVVLIRMFVVAAPGPTGFKVVLARQ